MATPRNEVFAPEEVGIYHCYTQCVRQLYLLGDDPQTQVTNDHRRQYFIGTLKRLAASMAVDVLDFAVMGNHVHVMLRNRPDIAINWSAREVAERWLSLHPGRQKRRGKRKQPRRREFRPQVKPSKQAIDAIVKDPERVTELRWRLSNISWFMKDLLEPLAHLVNGEDGVRGHFVASRFGCKRLEDEGAVLACSIYAALNPFRADMCDQPAEYPHTSFAYRVQGEMLRRQRELGMVEGDPADEPDSWLAALFVDGRAAAYDATMQPGPDGRPALTPQSNPFPSPRVSNKGYLTVDWPDYERLVRWTAEHLRCRADATQPLLVPEPLGALLRERGIAHEMWLDTIQNYEHLFRCFVGLGKSLDEVAKRKGQQWVQGVRECWDRFPGHPPGAPGDVTDGSEADLDRPDVNRHLTGGFSAAGAREAEPPQDEDLPRPTASQPTGDVAAGDLVPGDLVLDDLVDPQPPAGSGEHPHREPSDQLADAAHATDAPGGAPLDHGPLDRDRPAQDSSHDLDIKGASGGPDGGSAGDSGDDSDAQRDGHLSRDAPEDESSEDRGGSPTTG